MSVASRGCLLPSEARQGATGVGGAAAKGSQAAEKGRWLHPATRTPMRASAPRALRAFRPTAPTAGRRGSVSYPIDVAMISALVERSIAYRRRRLRRACGRGYARSS